MALEKLNFNIPADSKWTTADVEKRADDLGLQNKSDLMIKAVEMMVNFDLEFYKQIQRMADGLKIPEYLVMQNMIINAQAKNEVYGGAGGVLVEFTARQADDGSYKMLTGDELKKMLVEYYTRQNNKK